VSKNTKSNLTAATFDLTMLLEKKKELKKNVVHKASNMTASIVDGYLVTRKDTAE